MITAEKPVPASPKKLAQPYGELLEPVWVHGFTDLMSNLRKLVKACQFAEAEAMFSAYVQKARLQSADKRWESQVTDATSLYDVLDQKVAECLDRKGYLNVASVRPLTDAELLSLGGFGEDSLWRLRRYVPSPTADLFRGATPNARKSIAEALELPTSPLCLYDGILGAEPKQPVKGERRVRENVGVKASINVLVNREIMEKVDAECEEFQCSRGNLLLFKAGLISEIPKLDGRGAAKKQRRSEAAKAEQRRPEAVREAKQRRSAAVREAAARRHATAPSQSHPDIKPSRSSAASLSKKG